MTFSRWDSRSITLLGSWAYRWKAFRHSIFSSHRYRFIDRWQFVLVSYTHRQWKIFLYSIYHPAVLSADETSAGILPSKAYLPQCFMKNFVFVYNVDRRSLPTLPPESSHLDDKPAHCLTQFNRCGEKIWRERCLHCRSFCAGGEIVDAPLK